MITRFWTQWLEQGYAIVDPEKHTTYLEAIIHAVYEIETRFEILGNAPEGPPTKLRHLKMAFSQIWNATANQPDTSLWPLVKKLHGAIKNFQSAIKNSDEPGFVRPKAWQESGYHQ
jgi:hypothetical protein